MQFIITKPATGKLINVLPKGGRIVLAENKPFPFLQFLKKKYVQEGLKRETLKITY